MNSLRQYYDAYDALESCRSRVSRLENRNEILESALRHVLRHGKLGKQSKHRLSAAVGPGEEAAQ